MSEQLITPTPPVPAGRAMFGTFPLEEAIARVCHEANRGLCQTLGDRTQQAWDFAPEWQRSSAIAGVKAAIDNPEITPEASHEGWCAEKRAAGWTHGPVKDPEKKEHPCLVAYSELPAEQRQKDVLFLAVVRAFQPA
jgi:hypothetical protein